MVKNTTLKLLQNLIRYSLDSSGAAFISSAGTGCSGDSAWSRRRLRNIEIAKGITINTVISSAPGCTETSPHMPKNLGKVNTSGKKHRPCRVTLIITAPVARPVAEYNELTTIVHAFKGMVMHCVLSAMMPILSITGSARVKALIIWGAKMNMIAERPDSAAMMDTDVNLYASITRS